MRILYCLLLLGWWPALAQGPRPEPAHAAASLAQLLPAIAALPDTVRLDQLLEFSDVQIEAGHFDEAAAALHEATGLAAGNDRFTEHVEQAQGYLAEHMADFAEALSYYRRALDLTEATHKYQRQIKVLLRIAGLSYQTKDWALANQAQQQALRLAQQHHLPELEAVAYSGLSNLAGMQKQPAKASLYNQKALQMHLAAHDTGSYYIALVNQGVVDKNLGQYAQSARCFRQVIAYAQQQRDELLLAYAQVNFPRTLLHLHQPDEAERYARQVLAWSAKTHNLDLLRESNDVLTAIKEQQGQYQAALAFQRQATRLQDSLFNQQKSQQLVTAEARYQAKARQVRIAQLADLNARQQHQLWALLAGLALIGGLATVLARSNRQKHQANALLEQQKAALREQRDHTSQALSELKATQEQLVQREKMASLGELTAGIAHEIQNPLNFVNNFSEVSIELAAELQDELAQHPAPAAGLTTELLADLTQNLQKIAQHGQRAARIVHGMLEHSRQSTGERQPTDLNALCEEYARLAYHGLRAKDQAARAELQFDLAPHLPRLRLVAPDVGRVLLNLCTNAFYAVQQRAQAPTAPAGYTPTVEVSTAVVNQDVVIRIRDNGPGMSPAVQQKIFQPFFTTKPAGEGTGLGLSLSYDIITKGHGGSLVVHSQEGEGTELVVTLPLRPPGAARSRA